MNKTLLLEEGKLIGFALETHGNLLYTLFTVRNYQSRHFYNTERATCEQGNLTTVPWLFTVRPPYVNLHYNLHTLYLLGVEGGVPYS